MLFFHKSNFPWVIYGDNSLKKLNVFEKNYINKNCILNLRLKFTLRFD